MQACMQVHLYTTQTNLQVVYSVCTRVPSYMYIHVQYMYNYPHVHFLFVSFNLRATDYIYVHCTYSVVLSEVARDAWPNGWA